MWPVLQIKYYIITKLALHLWTLSCMVHVARRKWRHFFLNYTIIAHRQKQPEVQIEKIDLGRCWQHVGQCIVSNYTASCIELYKRVLEPLGKRLINAWYLIKNDQRKVIPLFIFCRKMEKSLETRLMQIKLDNRWLWTHYCPRIK